MAKSARRSGKGKASVSATSSGTSTPTSQIGPIPPFQNAPGTLKSFLEPLSREEVYLIHVDLTPQDMKQQAFLVPALMNFAIIAVIALRAWMVRYEYPALLATFFGLSSSMAVDVSAVSWEETLKTIFQRTGMFLIDYILLTVFLPWPVRFYQGPVRWRRTVGFRDREIIVRRSQRSWSKELERNRWIQKDDETRDKIVAAVTPERIRKTGYLLIDADWDLDYNAMIRAHELVDQTRNGSGIQLDEFRTAVLVNIDSDGWLIWHVADEETAKGKTRSAQRDQILTFKEKLTAMGKEELFFRWVELVQYESTRAGGYTPERQRSAMVQAKELFEKEGVDFSRFWQDVGGMEGIEELD